MLLVGIILLTLLSIIVNSFHFHLFKTKNPSIITTKLNAVAIEPAGSRSPADRPLSWKRNGNKESGKVLDYNWKYGICQHKVPFEGAQNIRKFKFCGDLLSFGLVDGKLVIIRLSSGEILDKFNEHTGEISAIEFDGLHLASGGNDGSLCFYDLTYNTPKSFGTAKHKLTQLHTKAITGMKIMRTIIRSKKADVPDEELVQVLTVGLDKRLVCTNYHTGKIDYQVQLQDTPLCMDYKDGYIAIGTSDGKVIFLKGSTGSHLLYFQTQTDKVRSVHLSTTNVLFTGSGDGRVVKWDLSGASSSEDTAVSNTKQQLLNEISTRPTRFLDYYFLEVRANVMNSVSTATTTQQRQLSSKADTSSSSSSSSSTTASQSQSTLTKGALMVYQDDNHRASVVSVQGDEDKLVVAYDDGTVSCWETATGKNLFDLKGRSKLISTVQYDDTRLIADGTYSAVVLHDFSDSPSAHNESSDELVLVLNSYGDEEEKEENDLKLE